MSKQDIIRELNLIQASILNNAYVEDWDGDDEESGTRIIRQVYVGLKEDELENILAKISSLIQKIKESE